MTRVVLLGASNVAIGFPAIVRWLSAGLSGPLEIFAAFGHGRSYCTWSRVLFRSLPGIDRCTLWSDLDSAAEQTPRRTLALFTDIGNDLIYGSEPDVIARRIEECLSRLAAHQAELVITRLPLASIERLSALRYHATKAVFFPRTRKSWPAMLRHARDMDQSLCEIAARFSARLIEQRSEWYGFDPIHIRMSRRNDAWRTIFAAWPAFQVNASPRLGGRNLLRLRLAAPAERRLFGQIQNRPQPSITLGDVAIRLY